MLMQSPSSPTTAGQSHTEEAVCRQDGEANVWLKVKARKGEEEVKSA